MKHRTLLIVLLAALLMLAILPVAAQEQGMARVRIGYFAFDPRENETYIDGERASFDPSWAHAEWAVVPWWADEIQVGTETPYFDVPSGVHSFAFVPSGDRLDSAVLEAEAMEFKPGHVYSLALVGQLELDDLKLMVVDETEAFTGVDPAANYRGILVHNIAGAPPVEVTANGDTVIENLQYREIATYTTPAGYPAYTIVSTVGDEPIKLFEYFNYCDSLNSELVAMIGTFPGEPGSDIFRAFDFGYPEELTVVDGGAVTIGDTLAGEVPAITQRVAYNLSLESDASVNLYVKATGSKTLDSVGSDFFDPMVYVYDSSGSLLFWNDNQSFESYSDNSGLEAISLKAGDYTIQVGGWADLNAGPYELVVERAE